MPAVEICWGFTMASVKCGPITEVWEQSPLWIRSAKLPLKQWCWWKSRVQIQATSAPSGLSRVFL